MSLLEIDRCTVAFGGLVALDSVSIHVDEGEIVGLIGPNGAGKTTLFNLVTGVCKPVKYRATTAEVEAKTTSDTKRIKVHYGDIIFRGKSIRALQPNQIVALGIARTFQNIRLFPDLTAFDNIRAACHVHVTSPLAASIFRTRHFINEEMDIAERSFNLLNVMGLSNYRNELAKNLPYGEQRRLEISRALATDPKLILLDEPAAGMNPQETHDLMRFIERIRLEFGVTVLLIEHDMKLVMGVCERVYVLDYGEIIAEGPPEVIKTDPKVIEAYLGEG